MRIICCFAVAALLAGPAVAGPGVGKISDEQIRSGAIIDDGLDIPHIRPGTLYFEIHGSTRIARALGDGPEDLPTGLASRSWHDEDEDADDAVW